MSNKSKDNNSIDTAIDGAFSFIGKGKNKSFKKQQPRQKHQQLTNHASKRQPTKAKNTQPKQRPTYPWTCLLDVKLVGKLDAIQKTFNLNNRSDALALIIKHCSKLIQSNEQRIEYKIFYKKFMQKNLPKAKRHYDKYFHK